MKKINIVFGATGTIGSSVFQLLVRKKFNIEGIDYTNLKN